MVIVQNLLVTANKPAPLNGPSKMTNLKGSSDNPAAPGKTPAQALKLAPAKKG